MGSLSISGSMSLSLTARSGSASFTPASLAPSAWYDPSDLATVWENSGRTIPASVNGVVGALDDKSGNGNHLIQATTAAKPILRLISGVYWLEFDGVDDFMARGAAVTGMTAPCTFMTTLRNFVPDTSFLLHKNSAASGDKYLGVIVSGGGGSTADNAGAANPLNLKVNGTGVADVRGTVYTAIGTGAAVFEYGSVNANTSDFTVSGYTGFEFNGYWAGCLILPVLSAGDLNSLRTYQGNKVGLTL